MSLSVTSDRYAIQFIYKLYGILCSVSVVCMMYVYTVGVVHWLMNVVVNIGYIRNVLAPISTANTCKTALFH